MLNKIKSPYILGIILKQNLGVKACMEIIKYNKKLQKKLNISLNDYKNYKKIELELIPLADFDDIDEEYYFININKSDKSYYHIYFDNKKEETNQNFVKQGHTVKTIKIIIDEKIKSFKDLFSFCNGLKEISITKCNRNDITPMNMLFYEWEELIKVDLSKLKTDNVENMSYMFKGCSKLNYINISNFNTSKVTNMKLMFSECIALRNLIMTNFNTKNVTDMSEMFYNCKKLIDFDVTCLNIPTKSRIDRMFYYCDDELKYKIKKNYKKISIDAFDISFSPTYDFNEIMKKMKSYKYIFKDKKYYYKLNK